MCYISANSFFILRTKAGERDNDITSEKVPRLKNIRPHSVSVSCPTHDINKFQIALK